MRVTVVIAALNEEDRIAHAIRSARDAGADEIIVADGGSRDATVATAEAEGARVVHVSMRARQLNAGAAVATGDVIIFLHADTLLPAGAAAAISNAVDGGAPFGAFEVSFIESSALLKFTAWMINRRTRITRCPYGDQAQFIARSAFTPFREIPVMEDYEMALRMKRRGRVASLPLRVKTSGRRFLQRGFVRTWLTNWRIIVLYKLGVSPVRLARMYRA